MKQQKHITNSYYTSDIPTTPSGLIQWITNKINEIPKDSQNHVSISFESEGGYDEDAHVPMIIISYHRLETNGEEAKRELRESELADKRRQREFEEYCKLRDKFEPKVPKNVK